MNNATKSLIVVLFLGCFLSVVQAQGTTTLTFDGFSLPNYGETIPVPNGYAGLQWGNFYVENPANSYQGPYGSGFLNGVVSPNNVIWNASGSPAQISRGTTFDLDSAYLTAAWMDGLQIQAQGFIGNCMTYNSLFTINTTSPALVVFDYSGVDRVIFTAFGGTQHYGQGSGSEFAIDNMIVAVPEPNGIRLLLLGTVCVGMIHLCHLGSRDLLRNQDEPA